MIKLDLDAADIFNLEAHLKDAAESAMKKATAGLAAAIDGHLREEAARKLKSRREMFVNALSMKEVEGVWVVNLDKKAVWIDDGMQEHEMIDDLLKAKSAKTAADGSRYTIVPFKHGPGAGKTNSTEAQLDLVSTIKTALKKQDIPFGSIEKNADGTPKEGLLHKLDITSGPLKTANVPGQGKGPIGSVRQGSTGTPFLQRLNIYQKTTTNPDGSKSTKRSIMTFRTVSSKQKGTGKWVHPGLAPKNLMDEAFQWALQEWEKTIAPQTIADLNVSL